MVIDNLGVSGWHAKIEWREKGVFFVDLDSTNGSFINEKPISSQKLEDGDVITIGKHSLLFAFDEKRSQSDDIVWGMDQTVVMETDKYRSIISENSMDTSSKKERDILGVLSFLNGGKGEFVLSKKFLKIGKGVSSDIFVNGFMVSQTAATISKRSNGYYLSNAGGLVKAKVNGKKVKDSVLLKELDIIKIGSTKMQLSLQK